MRASLPACLSPSAAALAHRRRAGVGRTRGAARKAERAMMEDMMGGEWRGRDASYGMRAARSSGSMLNLADAKLGGCVTATAMPETVRRTLQCAGQRRRVEHQLYAPLSAQSHVLSIVPLAFRRRSPSIHSLPVAPSPAGRHPRPSALPVFVATTRCTSRDFPPATPSAL